MKARRHGWTRNDALSKTAAVYKHVSGWQVLHCGHMTALWPFYLAAPDGRSLVAPHGRGFQKLIEAQVAVERTVNGESMGLVDITNRHSTGGGTGLLRGRRIPTRESVRVKESVARARKPAGGARV